jgi:translation elongation factor EF-G
VRIDVLTERMRQMMVNRTDRQVFLRGDGGVELQELLDIMVKLLPNPTEGNPPLFYKGEGDAAQEFRSEPDRRKHVLAHVFKVVMDPYVGKVAVFRVHQGTITKDSQLYIGENKKPFKVGHLFMLQGKEFKEVPRAFPGDLCAIAKVEELHFDAVLSVDELKIYKPAPQVYELAVQRLRVPKEKIGFISSNCWDALGAKSYGFTVHWINRSGAPVDALGFKPDAQHESLSGLVDEVLR